jgi:hypothetical protein
MTTSLKYVAVVVMLAYASNAFAQNDTYKHTISANAGFSLLGAIVNLSDEIEQGDLGSIDLNSDEVSDIQGQFNGNSIPAFQINYDYGLKKWISIGGGISYQRVGFDIENLSYFDESEGQQRNIGTVSADLNRLNIAARVLFHYANTERLDLYSGLRFGLTTWGTKVETTDAAFEEDFNTIFAVNPSVQVIPFALRGYITENLGISFETGLGAPHFFAIGLNYRL